ncbi:MAG: hypothetical protein U1F67_18635 [Rubrivivax sp.]
MSSIDIERQGAVAIVTMNHPERRMRSTSRCAARCRRRCKSWPKTKRCARSCSTVPATPSAPAPT